ncbi:MAG: Tat pathway signal protein [Lentisphaeria bacterium]|nr:Tat pathway signal protein [Lentisphaeria bacterium]
MDLIKCMLVRTSNNFWEDCIPPEDVIEENPRIRSRYYRPHFNCDMKVLHRILKKMSDCGLNAVLFDVGDSVRFRSRPDVGLPDALSIDEYKDVLKMCRDLGLEPFPKLNFSSCHDAWLGRYSRMLSTAEYYGCCRDLINETAELFDGPRLFHLGMDEEDYGNQRHYEYIVIRRRGLWWNDLNYLAECVKFAGSRPWVWSDKIWHCDLDEFRLNMPKYVMQSNWYYGPTFDMGPQNNQTERIKGFLDLNKLGYDQIPTGSNFMFPENFPNMVDFCEKNIKNIHGYMSFPCRGVLPKYEREYLGCAEVSQKAYAQLKKSVK